MNHKIKFTTIGFCVLGLSSCMIMEDSTSTNLNYPAYVTDNTNQFYVQNTYNMPHSNYKYDETYQSKQDGMGTDSYQVNETPSPVSFRDRDQAWVNKQNPQAYTIELIEGDKASQVAQTLYKAPKNEHMAQIKYHYKGKDYYKGLYGTYDNAAEAQKALDALPAGIKTNASVKSWNSVQP